jgi:hypothetical protein
MVNQEQISLFLLIYSFATYVRDAGFEVLSVHASSLGISGSTNRKNRVLRVLQTIEP